MVFVKGGTFMMGDVGYTDENGVKRHFAGDADVFPVHQVTLTSYSMNSLEPPLAITMLIQITKVSRVELYFILVMSFKINTR
jgi:hypothetical protein